MYKRQASDKKPELKITGVILKDGTKMDADAVIVATGGLSYPCLLYTSTRKIRKFARIFSRILKLI